MSKKQLDKLQRETEPSEAQLKKTVPKYTLKPSVEKVQKNTEWGKYKGKKKKGSKTLHKTVSELD